MQAKEKKKAVILGALIAVLLIYWGFTLFGGSEKKPAAAPGSPAAAKKAGAQKQAAVKVDIDLLKRPREQYEAKRNIFTPVYTKPELPKPKPLLPGGKGAGVGPGMKPLPPLPPPPPPKSPREIAMENAREEMKRIKVVGFLKRKGSLDVFMSLDNSNYIVKKGENITKQYFLDQVGKDSIMVSDRATGVQVTLAADFSGKGSPAAVPSPGMGSSPGSGRPAPQPYGGGRPAHSGAASPAGRSISVEAGEPAYSSVGGVGVTSAGPAAPATSTASVQTVQPPMQQPEPFSEGLTPHSVN